MTSFGIPSESGLSFFKKDIQQLASGTKLKLTERIAVMQQLVLVTGLEIYLCGLLNRSDGASWKWKTECLLLASETPLDYSQIVLASSNMWPYSSSSFLGLSELSIQGTNPSSNGISKTTYGRLRLWRWNECETFHVRTVGRVELCTFGDLDIHWKIVIDQWCL